MQTIWIVWSRCPKLNWKCQSIKQNSQKIFWWPSERQEENCAREISAAQQALRATFFLEKQAAIAWNLWKQKREPEPIVISHWEWPWKDEAIERRAHLFTQQWKRKKLSAWVKAERIREKWRDQQRCRLTSQPCQKNRKRWRVVEVFPEELEKFKF